MSKRTVFDHLTEQLDSVVKGRRYIISKIGKLKESVMDLQDSVANSSGGGAGMGSLVGDLKTFMQQTIGTLGQLKTSFNKLNNVVNSLSNQVQQLKSSVVSAPAAKAASSPAPAPRASPAPQQQAAAPKSNPPPESAAAPQQQAAPAGGGGKKSGIHTALERILGNAKSGAPSEKIGQMLDALRTSISKSDPLSPILFELSMEAGKLKSLGDKPVEGGNLSGLETKVEKWKSKV